MRRKSADAKHRSEVVLEHSHRSGGRKREDRSIAALLVAAQSTALPGTCATPTGQHCCQRLPDEFDECTNISEGSMSMQEAIDGAAGKTSMVAVLICDWNKPRSTARLCNWRARFRAPPSGSAVSALVCPRSSAITAASCLSDGAPPRFGFSARRRAPMSCSSPMLVFLLPSENAKEAPKRSWLTCRPTFQRRFFRKRAL